jgi:glycosyltransferase involved in cell wall biosynthesis
MWDRNPTAANSPGNAKMIGLLAIGNDTTIALPASEVAGDTHQRQLEYASILATYHLITKAPSKPVPRRIQLADNFWVHPCGRWNMPQYLLTAVLTGWQIVEKHRIQVVSAQDPFLTGLVGYLIARRFRLPFSLQFAADMVDNRLWLREKRAYPMLNRLAHWLIPRANTFRVVSEQERQKLIRMGVSTNRIWNLGWITDFSRFLQADGKALRPVLLGSSRQRIVLYVGRLAPQKDIFTLLNAFTLVVSRFPQTLLVLAGSGPLESGLRRQVSDMSLDSHVHFAGMIPYNEIPTYFAAADVFALSSLYEGNARVLAEAAASAKPAVSTDVSGARDTIVDGETGFVVPVGDFEAMAERLNVLLSHPETAAQMGQQARQHILSLYNTERLLAGFRDLWETTALTRGSEQ